MWIEIVYDPEVTFIGLDIDESLHLRWVTSAVPGIVDALRVCADGDSAPGTSDLVIAYADDVALTDYENRQGRDKNTFILVPKQSARELADALESVYRRLRPDA